MASRIGNTLFGLLVVAAFLAVVLATAGVSLPGWRAPAAPASSDYELPPSPVLVAEVRLETIEITDTYSGRIRPLERFSLGFEIAGRLMSFGSNDAGEPLDEGDRVAAGQVLAKLDDRVLVAKLREAKAQLEQAQSDMKRAEGLRQRGVGAITETEYQDKVTALTLAEARLQMAEKSLEDATLVAPAEAVISTRPMNVGESVNPQETVFELIQVDEVLLAVGVPEAYIGAIRAGQPVHVELLARDRFDRKRPKTDGRVWRVAEAADATTSLFEVEILIPNPDRRLKPGLIALGHIVVDEVQGFRIPVTTAVYRSGETYLFSVDREGKARTYEIRDAIEQGTDLVLTELPPEHRTVVVRGQHRLVDGRPVRLLPPDSDGSADASAAAGMSPQGS